MPSPAIPVHRSTPLAIAARKMERHRIHRLVVVDDLDETIPIGGLSMTDLVHAIAAGTGAPAVPGPPPDDTPFVKEAGELKESHSDRLAPIAPPLLDIDAYVEEFGRSVVPAYRRGGADREVPAHAGLARRIIPPATPA